MKGSASAGSGDFLLIACSGRNLSQKEIAEKIGITHSSVSRGVSWLGGDIANQIEQVFAGSRNINAPKTGGPKDIS